MEKIDMTSTGINALRSIDLAALEKMKAHESALLKKKRLVSRTLPDGCIITTTRNRIKQLYEDMTK